MTVPPDGASRMLKVEPVVPPPPLLKSTPRLGWMAGWLGWFGLGFLGELSKNKAP